MKLILPSMLLGLVVAPFTLGVTMAQEPTPSGSTPEPAETPVATTAAPMLVTFTVSAETSESGERQELPLGSELVLRGNTGVVCVGTMLDTAAINSGGSVSLPELRVTESSECGSPGDLLSVEVVFPPGSGIGAIVLYPIAYEPGTSKTLDIVIPAPVPVPGTGADVVPPATGHGHHRGNHMMLT